MQHLVVFKKHVNKLLMLLIHGFLVDKQKLFVNVNQLMICKKKFTEKISFVFIYSREELRLQAKRKGITTCLIRDAGMKIDLIRNKT
jgi:hypothetical protein